MKDLSPRPCCHCGKDFTPKYTSMQIACTLRCAVSYSKKEREGREKAERAQIKARKQALETVPQLIAKAQADFNSFIRLRDRDKGCFVCERPFLADVPGRALHAGHVRSRGAAGHLRFNEDNCMGECEGCNGPRGAKPHEIEAGAVKRIGQERFDALKNSNEPHKWTREELRGIAANYRAKLKELKEKGE